MKWLICISFILVAGCESNRPHTSSAAAAPLPSGWQAVSIEGVAAGLPGDWKQADLKTLDNQASDMSGDPGKALPGMCRSALLMFVETGEQGILATPPTGPGVVSLSTHERRDAVVAGDAARDFTQALDRSPLHTGGGATQEPTTLGGQPAVKISGLLNGSSTADPSMELMVTAIIGSSNKTEWRIVSVSPSREPMSLDEIAGTWTGK